MRVLLDTSVLFWAVAEPRRLGAAARAALESLETEVLVSAISAWEIAYKVKSGKFPRAEPLVVGFDDILVRMRATALPLTVAHGIQAGRLDWSHRDPFDRMLVAQALVDGATLVTDDRAILDYPGVPTLW